MKGFEVKYRDQIYKLCLEDINSVFTVILTRVVSRDETSLSLSGQDTNHSFKWLNVDNISLGDKIEIQFLELEEGSEPISLVPHPHKRDAQYAVNRKIAAYKRLKSELEEGGHI